MPDFAVGVEGLTAEGKAHWVLGIDAENERLLIAYEDGTMHWHPMSECKLLKIMNPEAPRVVIPVQPGTGIAVPNRVERRLVGRNGP